jgi:hypothetical protein
MRVHHHGAECSFHRWRRDSRADRSEFLLVPDPDRDAAFDLQRLEKLSQGVGSGDPTYHVSCLNYRMICLYWRG